jgi:hypothetical protein
MISDEDFDPRDMPEEDELFPADCSTCGQPANPDESTVINGKLVCCNCAPGAGSVATLQETSTQEINGICALLNPVLKHFELK